MKNHLIGLGIVRDYNPWVHHGESITNNGINDEGIESESYTSEVDLNTDNFVMGDDLVDLLFDATTSHDDSRFPSNVESFGEFEDRDNETPKEFEHLMQDLEADLYPGCKTYKRLEFIVNLLHNKVSGNWTGHSFSMLLKSLHRAFNFDLSFPKNFYEIKKYTKMLGLDYVKIDACVNHCALFWKEK